jgi:predicted O-methyltransferase YrrM
LIQDETVDIAFIDAIHTPKAVLLQYDILKRIMKPGGLILFDDIGFSEAMKACWEKIASSSVVS